MHMKTIIIVFIVLLAVAISSSATYAISSRFRDIATESAIKKAVERQRQADEDKTKGDIVKLRSCITETKSIEEQTSCFRKFYAGVLPELDIDDYNRLPILY